MMTKIAIIGAGNMGQALVAGILQAGPETPLPPLGPGLGSPEDLIVTDIDPEKLNKIKERWGVTVSDDNKGAVGLGNTIILAVKPGIIGEVLDQIADAVIPEKLIVSIAAGIGTSFIEGRLTDGVPVIRVMPNMPALIGQGVSAVCPGKYAGPEHVKVASGIFRSVGEVVNVEEDQMDAVTGLSGSGPAYVFTLIEALSDGGVKMGLPREIAQKLAAQTVLGAARMAAETGQHPALLREKVTSPGGTTSAGLHQLEAKGFRDALISAVEAATKRSQELGQL